MLRLLSLLAVIVTFVGIAIAAGTAAYSLVVSRRQRAFRIATLGFGWCALYMLVLVACSWAGKERIVQPGCEEQLAGFYLDRDLAISVAGVSQTRVIGAGASQLTAHGIFYVVKVKVRSTAKRVTLELYDPRVVLIDSEGNRYERSPAAESALAAATGSDNLMVKSVAPGEGYTKELVFDMPSYVLNPRLVLTEGDPVERFLALFLIGDPNSLMHKPTTLSLGV